jgi:uncharacterized protein YbbK (DUF523 family)
MHVCTAAQYVVVVVLQRTASELRLCRRNRTNHPPPARAMLSSFARSLSSVAATAVAQARVTLSPESVTELASAEDVPADGQVCIHHTRDKAVTPGSAHRQHAERADSASTACDEAVDDALLTLTEPTSGASPNLGRDGQPNPGVARTIPFPTTPDALFPRVAMSACLLGHEVRYNKGHCHARQLVQELKSVFELVPVCPEMDIGMGAPRPTLRLVGDGRPLARDMDMEDMFGAVRLYCPDEDADYTATMVSYAQAKVADLRNYGVDGFILKKDSPTCGLDRVKLYQDRRENAPGRSLYTSPGHCVTNGPNCR